MSIHINKFVRRQSARSPFSHWTLSDEALLDRIQRHFQDAKPGYREGVVLVPVPPEGFFSGVVLVKSGDLLVGNYVPRKENEEPRTHIYALSGEKMPALRVDVVLYSHAALAENAENDTDMDWEIVSVNAYPDEGDAPIQPGTLIANHLQESGGTSTLMTDSEFVAALRISRDYWKNRAMVADPALLIEIGSLLAQKV